MLLTAVFFGLALLPYGKVWSTETPFPSSALSPISTQSGFSASSPFSISFPTSASTDYEAAQRHGTSQDLTSLRPIEDDVDNLSQPEPSNKIAPEQPFQIDGQFHDSDGDISDSDLPVNQTEESTLESSALGPKKSGKFRGTAQIDCLRSPLVCMNAGWYQNCFNKAYGNSKKILYSNGPWEADDPNNKVGNKVKTPFADENRYNSGVKTSFATPCNAMPFSQLFYDRFKGGHPLTVDLLDNTKTKVGVKWIGLQADEWPTASMWNPKFVKNSPISQMSLRCMDHDNNGVGAKYITTFRTCEGHYVPEGPYGPKDKKGKRAMVKKGKWADFRLSPKDENGYVECRPLMEGDTFNVEFNFGSFDAKDQTHNDLRK
jgi:hypothetical protein